VESVRSLLWPDGMPVTRRWRPQVLITQQLWAPVIVYGDAIGFDLIAEPFQRQQKVNGRDRVTDVHPIGSGMGQIGAPG